MNKEQREQLASDLLAEAEHRRGRVVDLLRNAAAALASQPMEAEAKLGSQQSSLDFGAILRHGKEALLRVGEAAISPPPTVLSSVPAAIRTAFLDGYRQGIHDEFVNEEAAWNRSRSIHVAHNAEQHGTLPAAVDRDDQPAAGLQEKWLPMETAPKDGTLLRLLVNFDDHAIEDGAGPFATVGTNYRDDTGQDAWQIVGWCWEQDQFIDGVGTPIGWLPMLSTPPAVGVPEAVHVLRKAYEGSSAGLFNSGAPKHLWSAAMLELFESLDEEVQEEARETVMAHSDMRAVAAIDSVIALLAAPTPPASEQQPAISDEHAVQILLSGGTLVFSNPASEQQHVVVMPERCTEHAGDRDNLQWARGANWMHEQFLRLNPLLQLAKSSQGGDL